MTLFQDGRKIVSPKNKQLKTRCIKAIELGQRQWIYLDEKQNIAMQWMAIALVL
jgi:hypothetical protein